jgi:hypothetical protein
MFKILISLPRRRPGLRERLVLSEKRILSDSFWHYFARYFRFHWPYAFTEVYNINLTGRVQFTGDFLNYLHDIRNWRMDHQFFAAFPELSDDISPAPTLPPLISLPKGSLMVDPLAASPVESEVVRESEKLCTTSSASPSLVISSQNPWSLSQHDFAADTTPTWAQVVDSYFGLPT